MTLCFEKMCSNESGGTVKPVDLELVQLPPCRFWPIQTYPEPGAVCMSEDLQLPPGLEVPEDRRPQRPPLLQRTGEEQEALPHSEHFCRSADAEFWTDEFGLHPNSSLWSKSRIMMIRNIPARCTEQEMVDLISTIASNFTLEMPRIFGQALLGK